MNRIPLIILILSISFLWSCSSTQSTTNKNVAGIYIPGLNLLDPSFKVFHKNDTLTELYFRFNSENLLYIKKYDDTTFSANVLIQYQLVDNSTHNIIDSSSIYFKDYGNNKQKKYLDGIIYLPTKLNGNYKLTIITNDINREHYAKKKIDINRSDIHNTQNFLVLDTNNNVIYKNHFSANDKIIIKKSMVNPNNEITLKYYTDNHTVARPPFSMEQVQVSNIPEYTTLLSFDSLNTLNYIIEEKGVYRFLPSENDEIGLTLFNFEDHFPMIKTPQNMIGPLKYISTKKEFLDLTESLNRKASVDEFWNDITENNERARTLIREYYNRVENANKYFTSYMEGWKTDRGLIYIIYGTPNVVYKHKNYENWIYGEENNMLSISFIFQKVSNPISNHYFRLNRSPSFKSSWYRAVDSWRSGRIY